MLETSRGDSHPLLWICLLRTLFTNLGSVTQAYESASTPFPIKPGRMRATQSAQLPITSIETMIAAGMTISGVAAALCIPKWRVRASCAKFDRGLAVLTSSLSQATIASIRRRLRMGHTHGRIASDLSMDVSLVRYVALGSQEDVAVGQRRLVARAIRRNRRELLAALQLHGTALRSEIRRHCQAPYSWLLNHDRMWLESVLPPKLSSGGRSGRVQLDLFRARPEGGQ